MKEIDRLKKLMNWEERVRFQTELGKTFEKAIVTTWVKM